MTLRVNFIEGTVLLTNIAQANVDITTSQYIYTGAQAGFMLRYHEILRWAMFRERQAQFPAGMYKMYTSVHVYKGYNNVYKYV